MVECEWITLLNHEIAGGQSFIIIFILLRSQKVLVTVVPNVKFREISHLWTLLYLEQTSGLGFDKRTTLIHISVVNVGFFIDRRNQSWTWFLIDVGR